MCPYTVLVEKPEGRRPLGIQRCRWKNNIKIDLREVGWGDGMDPSVSGPSGSIKWGEFLE